MDYDQIESLYRSVIRDNPKHDLDKYRVGLSNVVKELREAHSEGLIGSVEGLPTPEEVMNYSPKQINDLRVDILMERYFPPLNTQTVQNNS